MGTHPIFESDFDCLTGMSKVEKVLNSRVRFKKNEPSLTKTEYLVKWRNVNFAAAPETKWVLAEHFPTDETSQRVLKAFTRPDQLPTKKRKQSTDESGPIEKRQKMVSILDEIVEEKQVDPVLPKYNEMILTKYPHEEITLTAVPPGHAIIPGVNKADEVKLGDENKREPEGQSSHIINVLGYRVIKGDDEDYVIYALVQLKNGRKGWLDVYSFDQSTRNMLTPRNCKFNIELASISEIRPCRDTFIIAAKTNRDLKLWLDESQLKQFCLHRDKSKYRTKNRAVFAKFIADSDTADMVVRYARSKKSHEPRDLDPKRRIIYESQFSTKKFVDAAIEFEETAMESVQRIKEILDQLQFEDKLDAQIGFGRKMEPKDLPRGKWTRESTKFEPKAMKNFIREINNEHYTEAKQAEMEKEVETKERAYRSAQAYFEDREAYYEGNKQTWKESKSYDSVRQARWDKDEARKEQTRRKKDLDATRAKHGPNHTVVNYNSSEAQRANEDTEFMFTLVERPYKLPADFSSKALLYKKDDREAIFEVFNNREKQRQETLRSAQTGHTAKLSILNGRAEFAS